MAWPEAGHPVWLVRSHIWFSLVDPNLETKTKTREALRY